MNGRGRWLFVFAGMAALAVLLLGVVLGGRPAPTPPPASPTPTAAVPSPASTPSPTPVPTTGAVRSYWVYFARDLLPPVGGTIQAIGEQNAVDRTVQRIGALMRAGAQTPPTGATNPAALIRSRTTVSGGFTVALPAVSVRIDGDLATAEFDIEDWGVRGAAVTQALVQQLVYTITEEPGIKRAMIVEKGKPSATIDQLVVDKPLSREDVFGYTQRGSLAPYEPAGENRPVSLTMSYSVDQAALGMARLVIGVDGLPSGRYPEFVVQMRAADDRARVPGAKYELDLTFPGGSTTSRDRVNVDRSPLRYISPKVPTIAAAPVNGWVLGLEDQRPWRAVVLFDPTRIVIDVGGPPQAISEDGNTAIYAPAHGAAVERTFRVSGAVRAFEAAFLWRVKDAQGAVLASGHGMASIGTSPVWGAFEVEAALPAATAGSVTLEVYQGSPKDGSEISVASIPLTIR